MSIPRPEYPRPQFERKDWMNLNGEWQFQADPGNSGKERQLFKNDKPFSRKILVPFAPESKLSGIGEVDFLQACWYRRSFSVPKDWAGRRVMLHFGAVDYEANVWVNEQHAGSHRGGYTPFCFDITKFLKEGENTIAVHAFDDTRSYLQASGKQSQGYHSMGCVYTRTTGIWQTVWLEAVPQTHIKGIRLHPNVDGEELRIEFLLDGLASGTTVHAAASAEGKPVSKGSVAGASFCALTLPVEKPRLWAPGKPFLYDLQISLEKDGKTIDDAKSYFGMRKVGMEGHKVLFNGKSFFMRTVLDQGFYPDGIYTAPKDEDLRRDVELSMELGFNGARLHMKVFEPRFLYWADKLGYVVWGEYPNWGTDCNKADANQRYIAEWLEAIQRDFNHPSIMGWCPLNETFASNSEAGFLLHESLYYISKQIDPARLCIDTSGYNHRVTDIYDVHTYEQSIEKFRDLFAALAKGETGEKVFFNKTHGPNPMFMGGPYFVSEYGGIWWDPEANSKVGWGYGGNDARPKSVEEYVARYKGLTETLLQNPRICGLCFTQLYDVEQEVNGLLTYDRRHKFDPAVIRAINQGPAAIES